MIAAVMCGGRATRMKSSVEKPMLKLGGMPLAERVISALAGSRRFDRVVAAVSPSTPKTKEFLEAKGVDVIGTAGEGYSQDLSALLASFTPARVFVAPADIPLLNSRVVSDIAGLAQKSPAVSVVIEKGFVEKLGFRPSVVLRLDGSDYCYSGITIFDTAKMSGGPAREWHVVMNRMEISANVNTKEEMELAEKLLVQRS